ncbi:MAG: 5'-methylthioadenosine/adenosylhomocysteine nucleosidase [Treponemataceae bacterium]|nr:5'-methylthioadenosine/adenosylhomocysteine nucleosidase [Spirochaetales bacterium]MDY6030499.1 5'-methylthioadenosine/adenosylhomocysteine nucleosidase [Treponemataceae bacterium]
MKFGIIGAMDVEIQLLLARMTDIKKTEYASLCFYEGILEGKSVVVIKSGIGKVNAALCAQILIVKFDATHIINTGIAGSMDKKLRILDTVVSTECVYHDADTTFFGDPSCTIPDMPTFFKADEKLVEKALSSPSDKFKIYSGRIASGDQFICTKEGKEKIKSDCNPMCVEMEGCAVAHTCFVNNVPFVIIRSISDNADENVTTDYSFNREAAAEISANIVCNILK